MSNYSGYTDKAASDKKVLNDVFKGENLFYFLMNDFVKKKKKKLATRGFVPEICSRGISTTTPFLWTELATRFAGRSMFCLPFFWKLNVFFF